MTLGMVTLAMLLGANNLTDLAAVAQKSTVRIDIELDAPKGATPRRWIAGSGVVVANGLVATCAHLFDDLPSRAARILVVPDGGTSELTATMEPASDAALDLAYLKVVGLKSTPAPVAKELPRVGDEVFFIGHPFNMDKPVLGVGVVASDEVAQRTEKYVRQLRLLHAAANKGNSGGGVFRRSDGRLVGIIQIKTGAVGVELRRIMTTKYGAAMSVDGLDPVKVLQSVISEMDDQLNMGVAGFLSVKRILPRVP